MKVNYKTVLYGELASGTSRKPDEVNGISWEFQDICCDKMQKLIDHGNITVTSEVLGLSTPPDGLELYSLSQGVIMQYCPFCGTKISFHETSRVKKVRTSSPPRVHYEYEYEEKPV
jgi:hypothetical protein